MSDPRPQADSDPMNASGRRLQFRLHHLFLLTTSVAIVCGLVAWLGWASLPFLSLAIAPIITLIVLTRTNGDSPLRALRIGAILPTVAFAGLALVACVMVANNSLPPGTLMPSLVLGPLLLGLCGGMLSILVSIPILAVWYVVRDLRRRYFEQVPNSPAEPPKTAP